MHFWVYILRCKDGSYYTGHSDNIEKRMAEHQSGIGSDWTRRRQPVTLVGCEALPSRLEALEAEHRIKPWSRAKKEGLIAKDWARVSHFARPPKERPSTEFILSDAAGRVEGLGTNAIDESAQTGSFVSSEGPPEIDRGVETRGREPK